MASSSRMREEMSIRKKNSPRIHKSGNRSLILNNNNNSPDRSPIWIEPNSNTASLVVPARKVPVLYYLSRNGHLEHPHLVDVTLSSPHGLYLRDVINTLNHHRGKGMANMYSWSFKRSYKSGYVWHDAAEDDLIQPTNGGHDYVIKGSEFHQSRVPSETYQDNNKGTSTNTVVKRNQSWSSFDIPQDYLVLKCESNRELASKFDPAAVQTVEVISSEEMASPPPASNSSSETTTAATASGSRNGGVNKSVEVEDGSGRMTATQVLLQLITCGADSVRHVVPAVKSNSKQDTMSVAYGKSLKKEVLK